MKKTFYYMGLKYEAYFYQWIKDGCVMRALDYVLDELGDDVTYEMGIVATEEIENAWI